MVFGKNINKYYIKYILMFVLGIIALIAVDYFQLLIPDIFGEIIDALNTNTLTLDLLKDCMKTMIVIAIVMFSGRFLWRITMFGTGVRVEANLRDDLFKKQLTLSQEFQNNNKTGAVMALYTNDLRTIRNCMGNGTIMLIDAIFLGGLSVYKMTKIDSGLTIVAAIPLVLLALSGGIVGKFMSKKWLSRQKAYSDMSDFAQESFSGLSVIKAFVKEAKELLSFNKTNKNNKEKNVEFVKAAVLLEILISTLINAVIVIIIVYGGILVYRSKTGNLGNFSVGDLSRYISFFTTLVWPMMAISQLINMSSQGKASLKRIDEVLNQKPFYKENVNDYNEPLKGKIEFKGLTFKYPSTDQEALKDISFTLNEGETLGILGKTGSGKTTLVDLLLRIYNIDEGMIYIDDVDIMKWNVKSLRDGIAYVPQDNFLYSDSIKSNIAFSSKTIDEEEVRKASKVADLDENVQDFKDKYDTILGERGVTLSGGQRQRASIARAILKDAQILILDDSLSAVDTDTEKVILEGLREVRKEKTTIYIAHRISTVKNLDKIIIIEDGKLIAIGNHESLLKTSKEYKRMVDLQRLEDEEGAQNEDR